MADIGRISTVPPQAQPQEVIAVNDRFTVIVEKRGVAACEAGLRIHHVGQSRKTHASILSLVA